MRNINEHARTYLISHNTSLRRDRNKDTLYCYRKSVSVALFMNELHPQCAMVNDGHNHACEIPNASDLMCMGELVHQ